MVADITGHVTSGYDHWYDNLNSLPLVKHCNKLIAILDMKPTYINDANTEQDHNNEDMDYSAYESIMDIESSPYSRKIADTRLQYTLSVTEIGNLSAPMDQYTRDIEELSTLVSMWKL